MESFIAFDNHDVYMDSWVDVCGKDVCDFFFSQDFFNCWGFGLGICTQFILLYAVTFHDWQLHKKHKCLRMMCAFYALKSLHRVLDELINRWKKDGWCLLKNCINHITFGSIRCFHGICKREITGWCFCCCWKDITDEL